MAGIQMSGFLNDRMGTVPMGQPLDPQDHIADSGHNDSYAKGRAATPTIAVGDYNMPQIGKPND